MNDNPLPQETEKDPESRKKECLKYMAEFQKAAAAHCAKSDLPVEALDTSIRALMILKKSGVNKVSDICTADFSGVADMLGIKVIDEIRQKVLSAPAMQRPVKKSYFDPDAYEKLLAKVRASGDAEDLKTVRDETDKCILYVQIVCHKENELNTAINPDRETIGQYDSQRHRAHEEAIISVSVLNRLAERNGIGPVYTGDPSQRHQVAAFCLELAGWLFENRRKVL